MPAFNRIRAVSLQANFADVFASRRRIRGWTSATFSAYSASLITRPPSYSTLFSVDPVAGMKVCG